MSGPEEQGKEPEKVDGVPAKLYVSSQSFFNDSFELGMRVLESGYKPNFTIAVWRGGSSPGCVIQEILEYAGVPNDHIAIRTSCYRHDKAEPTVKVFGLNYVVERVNAEDKVLIVDDVYDRGLSLKAVIDELSAKARKNTPKDIRIATVYYKPKNNQTNIVPDYYVHATDKWIVFPHEFVGLTIDEIEENKGDSIADRLRNYLESQDCLKDQ